MTTSWRNAETKGVFDLASEFFRCDVAAHHDKWDAQRCINRESGKAPAHSGCCCVRFPMNTAVGSTFARDLAVLEA